MRKLIGPLCICCAVWTFQARAHSLDFLATFGSRSLAQYLDYDSPLPQRSYWNLGVGLLRNTDSLGQTESTSSLHLGGGWGGWQDHSLGAGFSYSRASSDDFSTVGTHYLFEKTFSPALNATLRTEFLHYSNQFSTISKGSGRTQTSTAEISEMNLGLELGFSFGASLAAMVAHTIYRYDQDVAQLSALIDSPSLGRYSSGELSSTVLGFLANSSELDFYRDVSEDWELHAKLMFYESAIDHSLSRNLKLGVSHILNARWRLGMAVSRYFWNEGAANRLLLSIGHDF